MVVMAVAGEETMFIHIFDYFPYIFTFGFEKSKNYFLSYNIKFHINSVLNESYYAAKESIIFCKCFACELVCVALSR